MCDRMAISAYIVKIVEKDPFLRLQMRAKAMFNRHNYDSFNADSGPDLGPALGGALSGVIIIIIIYFTHYVFIYI